MNREPEIAGLRQEEAFARLATKSPEDVAAGAEPGSQVESAREGLLILNADDWGRDRETTERIFDCVRRGTVSSVSAMVFMQDSERAAGIAREANVDAGLHMNFTTP